VEVVDPARAVPSATDPSRSEEEVAVDPTPAAGPALPAAPAAPATPLDIGAVATEAAVAPEAAAPGAGPDEAGGSPHTSQ
jgi:hypothetical protein